MPLISIIVPINNVEKYIHRCIDSILAQTFTDFECILVDDCSPDNCPAICDEYARKDNHIKVIHNESNIGSSLSRKIGLDKSCGEYIQFIDADDYVEHDMIESLYTYATSGNYDMVCCDWYKHTDSNEVLYMNMPSISKDFVLNIKCMVLAFGLQGTIWNKFLKRKVYERIKFPIYNYTEDRYIVMQALFFSKNIGYLNKAFYHYMYNPNSIIHNKKKAYERHNDALNIYMKIIDFLRKNHEEDLSVFEPELSRRNKHIKGIYPRSPKYIINKILRVMIPVKAWRKWLRKAYFNLKK
jgi:glycosyltransferase involved in cell wall biosynthesis